MFDRYISVYLCNCTYSKSHFSNRTADCLLAAVWHMPVAVCTVMISWWWTERPSETCRVFFKDKISWDIGAFCLNYYRIILRCTALWKSKQVGCVIKHRSTQNEKINLKTLVFNDQCCDQSVELSTPNGVLWVSPPLKAFRYLETTHGHILLSHRLLTVTVHSIIIWNTSQPQKKSGTTQNLWFFRRSF